MKLRLSVIADEELASLLRWLRDDDISSEVAISPDYRDADPEHMGGGIEFVNVVLSNGIALASLIVAVASWLDSRRSATTVRIMHDDNVVELHGSSEGEIQAVVEALRSKEHDT